MKKIFQYSLALMVIALAFTACSDSDDYTPGTVSGPQVFFDKSVPTQVNLSNTGNSFTVPVSRYVTEGALTVPIELTDTNNLFKAPASVQFAAGEATADLVISYDPAQFEFNDYKSITLKIDDQYSTPYGVSVLNLKAGVPLTWKSLGKCTFVDDWFGAYTNPVIEVCEQNPNQYRIAKPFLDYGGDDYFTMDAEQMDDYFTFTVMQPGETLAGQTITKSGLVYFPTYTTGAIHPSYADDVICMLHASAYSSQREESFWVYSHVDQYQADGVTPAVVKIAASYYMFNYGGWNYTQRENPYTTIYFPGYEPLDYAVEVEYLGAFVNPDGDIFANASITMGEDVEEVKYALVAGRDVSAAVNGIIDGSIESETLSKSGQVQIPCDLTGKLSIVAVSYAGGEPQDYGSATFDFNIGAGETWDEVGAGDFTYTIFFNNDDGSPYVDEGLTVSKSSASDTYKVSHWGYDVDFFFTWDKNTNKCFVDEQFSGYTHSSYGDVYVMEADAYNPEWGLGDSYYDPSTQTFHFNLVYFVSAGYFGYGEEPFAVQWTTGAKASKAAKKQFGLKPQWQLKPVSKSQIRKYGKTGFSTQPAMR